MGKWQNFKLVSAVPHNKPSFLCRPYGARLHFPAYPPFSASLALAFRVG
jgi:hypothetical protein